MSSRASSTWIAWIFALLLVVVTANGAPDPPTVISSQHMSLFLANRLEESLEEYSHLHGLDLEYQGELRLPIGGRVLPTHRNDVVWELKQHKPDQRFKGLVPASNSRKHFSIKVHADPKSTGDAEWIVRGVPLTVKLIGVGDSLDQVITSTGLTVREFLNGFRTYVLKYEEDEREDPWLSADSVDASQGKLRPSR